MVVFPELSRPRTRILASCFLVFLRFSIMPKRPFLCVVIYHYVLNTGQINETVLKKDILIFGLFLLNPSSMVSSLISLSEKNITSLIFFLKGKRKGEMLNHWRSKKLTHIFHFPFCPEITDIYKIV